MHVRLVVTPVEQPVALRELALKLRAAEQNEDMELFQAHLREPGSIVLIVSIEPASFLGAHEVVYRPLSLPPDHEIRRPIFPRRTPDFREREFRPGGKRSRLLRHASGAGFKKK